MITNAGLEFTSMVIRSHRSILWESKEWTCIHVRFRFKNPMSLSDSFMSISSSVGGAVEGSAWYTADLSTFSTLCWIFGEFCANQ